MRRKIAIWMIAIPFLAAASLHARDIAVGGFLPYDFAPLPMNVFWTALLPLDLAVPLLLFLRKLRAALVLGLAIMVCDVAINAYAMLGFGWNEFAPSLAMQSGFLGYLIGVAPFLWRAE